MAAVEDLCGTLVGDAQQVSRTQTVGKAEAIARSSGASQRERTQRKTRRATPRSENRSRENVSLERSRQISLDNTPGTVQRFTGTILT